MDRDPNRTTRQQLLANFLASSFFAEDEATPVVEKLLRHPTDEEERALLLSYAREEDGHARILDGELARRGLPKGEPFWIQRVFRRMSARTSLLVQFYHVEIIAGCFYGAMAARIDDAAARDLLRRLLRDEARHIRLHRELLARQIARLGPLGRLKARALCFLFRWAFFVTAWYQARQLAPIVGEAGPPLRGKILRKLRADRPFLFGPRNRTPRPLDWWWTPPAAREPNPSTPGCSRRGRGMTHALARHRRIRIVVNPSARSGRGPRLLRDLAATLPSAAPMEWVVSRSAAHLRDLIAEAADAGPGEYEAVAVAGGDGSVRNALAALGSGNRIPLGVLPIGSGNDFAHDLGIPRDPVSALTLLTEGVPRAVDVGRIGPAGTRYCCVASVGLDEVALDVVHNSGLPRCKALNVVAALWALFTYRPRPLRIAWQGGSFEDEVMFAAVTNTRGYGGGFLISPGASVTDGALDLCIVARSGRLSLLSKFAHILRGTHAGLPRITLAQSPWVTIEDLRGGTLAALDGEMPDSATPLRLECEAGGLQVILPRRAELPDEVVTAPVRLLPAARGEEAA